MRKSSDGGDSCDEDMPLTLKKAKLQVHPSPAQSPLHP